MDLWHLENYGYMSSSKLNSVKALVRVLEHAHLLFSIVTTVLGMVLAQIY